VHADPIKPALKAPGTKRFKLTCDILRSTSAFKSNLRRYNLLLRYARTQFLKPDGYTRELNFAKTAGAAGPDKLALQLPGAVGGGAFEKPKAGRCRLTLSNPS